MSARRISWAAGLVAGVLLVAACSGSDGDEPSGTAPSVTPDRARPQNVQSNAPPVSPTADPRVDPPQQESGQLPPVTRSASLAALMREKPSGGRPRVVRTEYETDSYTRMQVTYRSGDATVSGVLIRPHGPGPFPGIVLNHGYIEPEIYVTGQGLAREQDALARAGFVVLHTDYRGHAASDPVTPLDRESRLAYTRDAVNAVKALEKLPYVDPDRLAMLGRSMGGGVTLNALVTHPGLVDAAVAYASVSSLFVENLRHFTVPNRPEAAQAIYVRHGTPRESPGFYRQLSSRTYFDRITEPVLLHHGTNDESCPFPWARATQRALADAGVDSTLQVYPGEMHSFVPQWQLSMDRTIRFLRAQFRASGG
jgi:uncharacterized protein